MHATVIKALKEALKNSSLICTLCKNDTKDECQLLQMYAVVIFMTERRCRLNVL